MVRRLGVDRVGALGEPWLTEAMTPKRAADFMEMANCSDCLLWDGPPQGGMGTCRRYAPRAGWQKDPTSLADVRWPRTFDDEWCGEWVPRPSRP